jgi:hypothetical protein
LFYEFLESVKGWVEEDIKIMDEFLENSFISIEDLYNIMTLNEISGLETVFGKKLYKETVITKEYFEKNNKTWADNLAEMAFANYKSFYESPDESNYSRDGYKLEDYEVPDWMDKTEKGELVGNIFAAWLAEHDFDDAKDYFLEEVKNKNRSALYDTIKEFKDYDNDEHNPIIDLISYTCQKLDQAESHEYFNKLLSEASGLERVGMTLGYNGVWYGTFPAYEGAREIANKLIVIDESDVLAQVKRDFGHHDATPFKNAYQYLSDIFDDYFDFRDSEFKVNRDSRWTPSLSDSQRMDAFVDSMSDI